MNCIYYIILIEFEYEFLVVMRNIIADSVQNVLLNFHDTKIWENQSTPKAFHYCSQQKSTLYISKLFLEETNQRYSNQWTQTRSR